MKQLEEEVGQYYNEAEVEKKSLMEKQKLLEEQLKKLMPGKEEERVNP